MNRMVDVVGASLHVEVFGEGAPVLMPTGGGVPFYRNTFSPEYQSQFRTYAVEMRGTGKSTGSMAGATFASLADDLEHARQQLGLERPLVLGHSNHGCIALEHALRHPGVAAGVVSLASAPDFSRAFSRGVERWEREADPARRAVFDRLQAEFNTLDATALSADEVMFRRYLSLAPLGWRDAEFDSEPLWGGAPVGLGAYFDWLFAFSASWNLVPRLPEIEAPVLAVSGRYDYLCPVELWEAAIDRLPRGELVVLEESAHNPQFEQPRDFEAAMLRFARQVL